jgi:hypothetical protein
MKTPESIKHMSQEYKSHAWEDYTPSELGDWVSLLLKRSSHRANKEKAQKDLLDAQNYLNMLQEYVNDSKNKTNTGE